jgi:hypothetical protein
LVGCSKTTVHDTLVRFRPGSGQKSTTQNAAAERAEEILARNELLTVVEDMPPPARRQSTARNPGRNGTVSTIGDICLDNCPTK